MTSRIACIIFLVMFFTGVAWGQLEWHQINQGTGGIAPPPRRDSSLGYDSERRRLVIFGGRDNNGKKGILRDTWIYDIQADSWREVNTSVAPPSRFSMVYGVSQGHFYIATGEGPNRVFFNDIWQFNLQRETWEETKNTAAASDSPVQTERPWDRDTDTPALRYGAAGGIYVNSSTFYLSHGFSDIRYGDTFTYNLQKDAWYRASYDQGPYQPNFPHARCLSGSTMFDEDMLVMFGGCLSGGSTGGACPAGDTWIFDGKSKTWTEAPGCASPRIYSNMATLPERNGEKRVILYGGEETNRQVLLTVESPANQIAVLNPATMEWSLRSAVGYVPKKRSSVAMATSHVEPHGVYMFGGYDIETDIVRNDLLLLRGDASTADSSPLQSAGCNQSFFNLIMLHGVLMVLAWGVLLPWGAFIARYVKHKRPLWFNLHRLFQSSGIILAVGGLICAILSVQFDHFKFVHGIVGAVVMVIGLQQPFNALCRPHPPEAGQKKSKRRLVWELFHKFLGRCGIGLALANISLGVFLANSSVALWATWFAYLAFFILSVLIAEAVSKFKQKNSNKIQRSASALSRDSEMLSNGTDAADTRDLSGQVYITRDNVMPAKEFTKTGFDDPPAQR